MAEKPSGGEAGASRGKQSRDRQLEERNARLAAALRSNLHRRKQQARGRAHSPDDAAKGGDAGQLQERED